MMTHTSTDTKRHTIAGFPYQIEQSDEMMEETLLKFNIHELDSFKNLEEGTQTNSGKFLVTSVQYMPLGSIEKLDTCVTHLWLLDSDYNCVQSSLFGDIGEQGKELKINQVVELLNFGWKVTEYGKMKHSIQSNPDTQVKVLPEITNIRYKLIETHKSRMRTMSYDEIKNLQGVFAIVTYQRSEKFERGNVKGTDYWFTSCDNESIRFTLFGETDKMEMKKLSIYEIVGGYMSQETHFAKVEIHGHATVNLLRNATETIEEDYEQITNAKENTQIKLKLHILQNPIHKKNNVQELVAVDANSTQDEFKIIVRLNSTEAVEKDDVIIGIFNVFNENNLVVLETAEIAKTDKSTPIYKSMKFLHFPTD